MALTTASMPPVIAILVWFSAGESAKFSSASHPCSCTSALYACVCMALTTASMSPALAILVWFSAGESAKFRRAVHPLTCKILCDRCRSMIWMIRDSWLSRPNLRIAFSK
jgi:hypothetical protein